MVGRTAKRIAPTAYEALAPALVAIIWNKVPFERFIRSSLRDVPELAARLNFNQTKRETVDELVQLLIDNEDRYQGITLKLMVMVSSMGEFPNLEQQRDADELLAKARKAVERLRKQTEQYREQLTEQERHRADLAARAEQVAAQRRFDEDLAKLRAGFLQMHKPGVNVHQRGYDLEQLLYDCFELFDFEPHLKYDDKLDQIDGSLTFDTDNYIVEARWRKDPASLADARVFDSKVRDRGKNALGLFVSIRGFSANVIERFDTGTSFITLDGQDLMLVLEGRVRLDDLLKRKKRHADDTGSCHFPATSMIS